jgi:hypothetical protein
MTTVIDFPTTRAAGSIPESGGEKKHTPKERAAKAQAEAADLILQPPSVEAGEEEGGGRSRAAQDSDARHLEVPMALQIIRILRTLPPQRQQAALDLLRSYAEAIGAGKGL